MPLLFACLDETPVDIEKCLLLSARQERIRFDDLRYRRCVFDTFEEPGLLVQCLCSDRKRSRQSLEDFRRRFAQPALDLGEIWIGYPCRLSELSQGNGAALALFANEFAEFGEGIHVHNVLSNANYSKR